MDQRVGIGGPTLVERVQAAVVVLVTNAIPVYGVLRLHWSVANVVVLFWIENLLVAAFTCLRIAVHRALTRKRGHWRSGQLAASSSDAVGRGASLLGDYARIAFVFTLAHGVFVLAIVAILAHDQAGEPDWQFSWTALRHGALLLVGVLGAGFLADLPGMRERPFAWVRFVVQQRMGRVLVLHLAIIFGMMAMSATHSALGLLFVLIGLKTAWELATTRAAAPMTDRPPAWALRLGERFGRDKGGAEGLAREWMRDAEASRRRAAEDEETMPA
ncbi:DUF6498-containing protein [Dokdonella sp.]|uniref:DUF6498-containing protein n=1 Tax=Dokdonella sp. TaxID=2291710 RepID=UPI002F42608C